MVDFVLFCDLERLLTLLQCNPVTSVYELVSRRRTPMCVRRCETIDDDTFLCAENKMNSVVFQTPGQGQSEIPKDMLKVAQIHLGKRFKIRP